MSKPENRYRCVIKKVPVVLVVPQAVEKAARKAAERRHMSLDQLISQMTICVITKGSIHASVNGVTWDDVQLMARQQREAQAMAEV